MIEVGMILLILSSVPIPFGFIEYPYPQEYQVDRITHICGSDGGCDALNHYKVRCIAKVDYEK